MKSKITRNHILSFTIILINARWLFVSILKDANPIWSFLIIVFSLLSLDFRKLNFFWFTAVIISTILCIISPNRMIDAWYVMFALLCLNKYPIRNFCKLNLICSGVILIVMWLCLSMGIITVRVMGKAFDAYFESKDFGFGNPNTLASFIFFNITSIYYLMQNNQKFKFCIILILTAIFSFLYSGSRTYLFAEIVMLFLIIIQYFYPKPKFRILLISIIALIFYSFYVLLIENSIILNILLSGRLDYLNSILSNMTIKSSVLGYTLQENEVVDNSYIAMIIYGGLLYFFLFMFLLFKALIKNFSLQYKLLPITIPIILSGFMESGFVVFGSSNVLIIWLILLLDEKKKSINNCTHIQCQGLYR